MGLKLNNKFGIGAFFTPLKWAEWFLDEFNVFDSWLKGATVCDPTAGNGQFLEAFISLSQKKDITVTNEMLHRLYGIEKEKVFVDDFFIRIKNLHGIDFPKENYINADIIFSNPRLKTDILVGNPPWMNFTDLPENYKRKIKPYFYEYGLVDNSQKLLLGSSRIDIAALILSIAINDNLNKNGNAYFFVPLSIFLNDGAHSGFRKYVSKDARFALQSIYDFKDYNVFSNVSTRYGVAHFKRDIEGSFPIKYKIKNGEKWVTNYASPIYSKKDPLSIFENKKELSLLSSSPAIEITENCKPRQGINTCGANEVFIFKVNETPSSLPHKFLFPLVSKENFLGMKPIPQKLVLLPYDMFTGQPLSEPELKKYPCLWDYLIRRKRKLANRRGTLINTWIKKGKWWALLGVGKYSFAPYKIIWNAYGQKTFLAKLFTPYKQKPWQGNQSLHAYMPFFSKKEAERILSELSYPLIEKYLLSFGMEGTCNWAQPGKMKKLFSILNNQLSLGF